MSTVKGPLTRLILTIAHMTRGLGFRVKALGFRV